MNVIPQTFNSLIPVQSLGGWSLSQQHRTQVGPILDRMPFHCWVTHALSHTHSAWDNVDMSIHFMYTALGCGRKLEYWEKIHTNTGRKCNPHKTVTPGGINFFHQCYYKVMLNVKTLLEDLLY